MEEYWKKSDYTPTTSTLLTVYIIPALSLSMKAPGCHPSRENKSGPLNMT